MVVGAAVVGGAVVGAAVVGGAVVVVLVVVVVVKLGLKVTAGCPNVVVVELVLGVVGGAVVVVLVVVVVDGVDDGCCEGWVGEEEGAAVEEGEEDAVEEDAGSVVDVTCCCSASARAWKALAARGPATAPVTVDDAASATMTRRLTAETISSAKRAKTPFLFRLSSSISIPAHPLSPPFQAGPSDPSRASLHRCADCIPHGNATPVKRD